MDVGSTDIQFVRGLEESDKLGASDAGASDFEEPALLATDQGLEGFYNVQ